MKTTTLVGLATAATLVLAFATSPADAAKRKRALVSPGSQRVVVARTPTRITVRRRSFLDPGTETKQYQEHYADYAFPPGYQVYYDKNDAKGSFNRMPLPDPWDIPGWPKF